VAISASRGKGVTSRRAGNPRQSPGSNVPALGFRLVRVRWRPVGRHSLRVLSPPSTCVVGPWNCGIGGVASRPMCHSVVPERMG
jgi:hypothetical protein